jgi:hypothetical protein
MSMVHEILGIRALRGFAAGGRIATIACGMIGIWRRKCEELVYGRPGSIRPELSPPTDGEALERSTHVRTGHAWA